MIAAHFTVNMGCGASRVPGDIKLYYMPLSAPCRSVMLTASSLGIKLNFQNLDLMKQEHLTPEFIKLNPQHCIPTLDDEGFVLWESRAICAYLVNMYGKDDSMYPKDPQKRAIVDARLDFDQGTLNQRLMAVYTGMFKGNLPTEEAIKSFHDAMDILEILLTTKWVAGNELTIADMCIAATITTAEAFGEDISKWKNINSWLKRARKEIYGFKEANQDGVDQFKVLFKGMLEKLQNPHHEHHDQHAHHDKSEHHDKSAHHDTPEHHDKSDAHHDKPEHHDKSDAHHDKPEHHDKSDAHHDKPEHHDKSDAHHDKPEHHDKSDAHHDKPAHQHEDIVEKIVSHVEIEHHD